MMMNRRHAKNALAAQFERAHLQNHRERFHHKYSADKKQQNLLLDDYRNDTKRSTKRKRTDVAHENFGGMRVVPQKTERSANQRAAKNGQFADPRDVLNVEVGGPARVTADVGQHGQRASGNHAAADRQAIEAVGKIHRIRGASDNHSDEQQKRHKRERPQMTGGKQRMNHQLGMEFFQERHHQLRGVRAVGGKRE